jgi:hypothetical protein
MVLGQGLVLVVAGEALGLARPGRSTASSYRWSTASSDRSHHLRQCSSRLGRSCTRGLLRARTACDEVVRCHLAERRSPVSIPRPTIRTYGRPDFRFVLLRQSMMDKRGVLRKTA